MNRFQRPEYLRRRRVRGQGSASRSAGATHRDDEGQRVDHSRMKGMLEDLLPDVALWLREVGFREWVERRGHRGGAAEERDKLSQWEVKG